MREQPVIHNKPSRANGRIGLKLFVGLLLMLVLPWRQPAFAAGSTDLSAPEMAQLSGNPDYFLAPVAADTITNTVSVGSTTADANPLNNTAVQTTTITSQADLQVRKSDGIVEALPGTTVVYTIIITNAGPSAVTGATVSDVLPVAIRSASWTCSATGGSGCSAASGSGNINTNVNLAVNGQATFVVTAAIDPIASGTLVNTATVTPPAGTVDPVPGNNSSTDTDTLLTGTLTGTVFLDGNGNVTQDGGEGLDNVAVVITTSVGTTLTVFTNSTGNFTATVPAGVTLVDVRNADLPAGAVLIAGTDSTSVNVPAGGTAQDINGYEQQGQVIGHIFEDVNGDGNQDAGEPDLPNVNIVISDTFGVIQTATTDANGNYTATVPIGSTTTNVVESTLPAGSVQTAGIDPTMVTVNPASTANAGNDGYQRQGLVDGVVYMDENGDGVYTPGVDTPLGNVNLVITDSNGVTYTVTTNGSGAYSQTVPAGDTSVDAVDNDLPAGVVLTGGSSDSTTVNVPGGGRATDDTGYLVLSNLGDRVWLDLNGDGVQDADEPGLPNVVIELTTPSSAVITTTTGPDGYYSFIDLNPGAYTVQVRTSTLPAGVTQTGDRDAALDHQTGVTIQSNSQIVNADFGYQGDASIGDLVWHDRNGDGIKDGDEFGIANVVITLTLPGGTFITTTTSSTGAYTFTGLIPGDYTVDVTESTLPTGAVLTTANEPLPVALTAGSNYATADFGYQRQGQLTGHIFEDVNGNGTQDSGEPDLNNISVVITDGIGVTQTVVTDANGNYTATVPFGNTIVDVVDSTLPAGSVQTAGTDPSTTFVDPGTLTNAGDDGYQRQGRVQGTVYVDVNNDGAYSAGVDSALTNVHVVITDSNNVTYTVLTNNSGYFSKTVPAGVTSANVTDADLQATLTIENGFGDPQTVNVPGGGVATTNYPYVEPLTIDEDTLTPNVIAGTQATYQIVLRNLGSQALTNVIVSDTLPAGFTYASSSVAMSNASRNTTANPFPGENALVWNSWTIGAGGAVTITLTADVASSVNPGVYDNTALARSDWTGAVDDDGLAAQDSHTPNGEDPENDEDVTITTLADLSVTKTDDRDPVAAGTTLTYTIVVANAGPSDARNVVVTDTLPSNLTFRTASAGCTETGGVVTCDAGTVPVGTSVIFTIVTTVDAAMLAHDNSGPAVVTVEAPIAAVAPQLEPTVTLAQAETNTLATAANAGAALALVQQGSTPSVVQREASLVALGYQQPANVQLVAAKLLPHLQVVNIVMRT